MLNAASTWQLRLQNHFTALSARKRNAGQSIFAIEHALGPEEVKELSALVRAELDLHGLRSEHWLLWVVYAAECGYRFNGLQFWEDFNEQTPHWYLKGDRQKIREWFRKFQSDFSGIEPQGRWSSHFSIISWPITHAILPRDLQRRLAHALYEAQYELRRIAGCSYVEIGRALRRKVNTGSQRFLLFLEQEALVGQIVTSLLESTEEAGDGIEKRVLTRISQDLNAMQDAQHWISQAQRTWRSRAPQFRVINTTDRSAINLTFADSDKSLPSKTITLRPVIEAQNLAANSWRFELTVPSFDKVAALDPHFRDFLGSTRVSIPCAATPMLPGGWLLVGIRKRILKSWPTSGEGLLRFEAPPPFDGLVNWSLALPSENVWVFKFQSDGTGRLLYSNELRPDCSYLIVSTSELDLSELGIKCECIGVSVWEIHLPMVVTPEACAQLESVGLQCARRLTVSAVGMPPLQWSSDCGGEWLSSCRPMLSIARDHQFEGYMLRLDESAIVEVSAKSACPALVELPFLSPGEHELQIQTFSTTNAGTDLVKRIHAAIHLPILIRDPKPWVPGEINYPGMFVASAPLNPSIEDFLAGSIDIEVLGSNDVHVIVAIILKDSSGQQLLKQIVIKHNLPISHEVWKKGYRAFLQESAENEQYYAANTAYLEISSVEYGIYKVILERLFSPIRWSLGNDNGVTSMRLVEHGVGETVQASFCDFSSVFTDIVFTPSALCNGLAVSTHGGLFRAKAGPMHTDVIYAPKDIRDGLAALQLPVSNQTLERVVDFGHVLDRAAVWHAAQPLTYLAKLWQRRLVKELFKRVICHYCGRRWHDAEQALGNDQTDEALWEKLESTVGVPVSYGIAVGKVRLDPYCKQLDCKTQLLHLIRRHKIEVEDNIFNLAWQLAWFDENYETLTPEALDVLEQYGSITRAARLMRLRFLYGRFDLSLTKGQA